MVKKILFSVLLALSIVMTVYGVFFRKFLIYDNLEKFDKLKNVGITIKVPGYSSGAANFKPESQWFSEPELVRAMTFEGVKRYRDGKLISNYPDLRMLKGRIPCPT
ncbi:MAG: hypothetical protein ACP5U1_06290 [Desulfomonilaceae bacterium]